MAVPLHALAKAEDTPPLLTHMSVVLNNWRRVNPDGPINVRNLKTLCCFLGSDDEAWFYLLTVEIEARGGGVFGALLQVPTSLSAANVGWVMPHKVIGQERKVAACYGHRLD